MAHSVVIAFMLFSLCSLSFSTNCISMPGFNGIGCQYNGHFILIGRTFTEDGVCRTCRCLYGGIECCPNNVHILRTDNGCMVSVFGCTQSAIDVTDQSYMCSARVDAVLL